MKKNTKSQSHEITVGGSNWKYAPQDALPHLWGKVPSYIKITLISTFILGLLTHILMLTNIWPNHDGIGYFIRNPSLTYGATSGRWFRSFPTRISSNMAVPSIKGLLAILYLSISACYMVASLQIKKEINCILGGFILVSFPVVASTFSYMFAVDAYFFSLMLAVAAVYYANRYSYGFIGSIILITLSLGIYQAYFPVTVGLMVSILITDILRNQLTLKQILIKSSKFVASLVLSMALYFLMIRIVGVELSGYMGISEAGKIPISGIPSLLHGAYLYAYSFFFDNSFAFHSPKMKYVFLIIALVVIGAIALIVYHKQIRKAKLWLLIALLITLPLATTFVYVMSHIERPHLLMLYGFVVIFLFVLAVIEIAVEMGLHKSTSSMLVNIASWVAVLALLFSSFNYWRITNRAYYAMFFIYEQGYSYSSQLISRIQSASGYSTKAKIYFVGRPSPDPNVRIWLTPDLQQMTGMTIFIPGLSVRHQTSFLRDYMGFSQEIISIDSESLLEKDFCEEVINMPTYPNDGSILVTDEGVIVKFINFYYE